MIYKIQYGKHSLRYLLNNIETRLTFGQYMSRTDEIEYDVWASPQEIEDFRTHLTSEFTFEAEETYSENRTLKTITSYALRSFDCLLFHAVSFVYKGRAWLLTAPSGTGKTTQYMNWQRSFPGEITMISGDTPALECCEDGKVMVYSTPWNGKENIGNMISAELEGIVFLSQGDHNELSKNTQADCVGRFMSQIIGLPKTEEQVLKLAKLTDQILNSAHEWSFVNLGNDASTAMLREAIQAHMSGKEGNINAEV